MSEKSMCSRLSRNRMSGSPGGRSVEETIQRRLHDLDREVAEVGFAITGHGDPLS